MADASPDTCQVLTLPELAERLGKSERQVQRMHSAGAFPMWKDPIRGCKVTTIAAVNRAREMAEAKAMVEFEQQFALNKRRGRR